MQANKKAPIYKEFVGIVRSDKMNKTRIVEVERFAEHPVFKKRVRIYNKFKVHDGQNAAKTGDFVRIRRTRPLSKDKRWRLLEIIKKADS